MIELTEILWRSTVVGLLILVMKVIRYFQVSVQVISLLEFVHVSRDQSWEKLNPLVTWENICRKDFLRMPVITARYGQSIWPYPNPKLQSNFYYDSNLIFKCSMILTDSAKRKSCWFAKHLHMIVKTLFTSDTWHSHDSDSMIVTDSNTNKSTWWSWWPAG